ncbi:hypothetical protein KC363_g119 [Hortaea werneckii]|nr:hypothetical protein KC363_g119 [Hortaea werneckii]
MANPFFFVQSPLGIALGGSCLLAFPEVICIHLHSRLADSPESRHGTPMLTRIKHICSAICKVDMDERQRPVEEMPRHETRPSRLYEPKSAGIIRLTPAWTAASANFFWTSVWDPLMVITSASWPWSVVARDSTFRSFGTRATLTEGG